MAMAMNTGLSCAARAAEGAAEGAGRAMGGRGYPKGLPFSLDRPPEHGGALPKACDVAIIGGGIIGVMTAYYLAGMGRRVVLCEKGRVGAEQSGRNWGWVRQQGRDPAELPIMMESNRIWHGLAAELGEGLGFRRCGITYLARDLDDLARYEAWLVHAQALGLDSRMIGRAELAQMMPGHRAGWLGGLHTGSDARAEPWQAVPLLARAAAARGAVIVENCAVRGLDIAAGRLVGLVTEQGRLACARAVLAGGAWSSLLARGHGLNLPQLSVRATVAATAPLPEVTPGAAADHDFAFRRRADGGYTLAPGGFHEMLIGPDAFRHLWLYRAQIRADLSATRFLPAAPKGYPDAWQTPRRPILDRPGPYEAMRILDPRPHPGAVAKFAASFARAFPSLGPVTIASAWAGMIDTMPDVVPVIDHAAAIPGLTIATGMAGHGFGIGPGIGRVLADLVEGRPTGHDLHRFRLSRFTDGAPIDLGPAL